MEIIVAISGDRPATGVLSELETVHIAMTRYMKELRESRERERLQIENDPALAAKVFSDENMNSREIELKTLTRLFEKLTGALQVNASKLSINQDGIIESGFE